MGAVGWGREVFLGHGCLGMELNTTAMKNKQYLSQDLFLTRVVSLHFYGYLYDILLSVLTEVNRTSEKLAAFINIDST